MDMRSSSTIEIGSSLTEDDESRDSFRTLRHSELVGPKENHSLTVAALFDATLKPLGMLLTSKADIRYGGI